jgi:TolB-like protein
VAIEEQLACLSEIGALSARRMPFDNLSDDPGQEYFADGMVEDIINGLSRIK